MSARPIPLACAIVATVAFVCAFATTATAATRYAAPGGTGPPMTCPQANPCSLTAAVEDPSVAAGDLVLVAAGPYILGSTLDVTTGISVGGAPGAVPLIVASTPGVPAISVDSPGAVLHDVAVFQTADDRALEVVRGTAERVAATSDGSAACSLGATGGELSLIRDGTCWSRNGAGNAVELTQAGPGARSGVLRNLTAYATATGGRGIQAAATGGGSVSLDARNVIASGTSEDVTATAAASSSTAISLVSSNYDTAGRAGAGSAAVTAPGAAANQTAAPLLVDPSSGDFEQRRGSPTIDAGSSGTLMGAFDLQGEPRLQGPAPDIGADERDGTPPHTTIESGPAAVVRTGKVTFAFSADEAGASFECRVDDDSFQSCGSPYTTGSQDQGIHTFQVRATDPSGNVEKPPAERSFDVDKVIAGANAAAKRTQRLRGKRVSLKLTVRAAEDARARGAGTVRVGGKEFRFSSRLLQLPAGRKRTMRLTPAKKKASRKILKALKRGEKAETNIAVTFSDGLGNRATTGRVPIKVKIKSGGGK